MSIKYGLVFTFLSAQFDIPYSILFVQVALSHFSKFKIIVGMSLPCFCFQDSVHIFKALFSSCLRSFVSDEKLRRHEH